MHFEHRQDTMDFQVTSAWYPVKEFAMNLYNQLVDLDSEVAVEVRYEDETYEPVGGILVYDGHIFQEEDHEFEYPDEEDFEDDYDGEYSVIRVATSSGGSVIGHPEQHVRVGARHIVSLVPDPFYKLDRIVTTQTVEMTGTQLPLNLYDKRLFPRQVSAERPVTPSQGELPRIQVARR